jgi:isopenicillin-N epimerase
MSSNASNRDPSKDSDWEDLKGFWPIRPDTTYLNHGSFGPPAQPVREFRQSFIDELDCQPMDFYLRRYEPLLLVSREKLAGFVGTKVENLVFAENATFAMNVVADSFPLESGDEVVTNNHEYGAVQRIWDRACKRAGAKCVVARLPDKIESTGQVLDHLLASCSDRTRLIVVSHVTSATAIILPVAEICTAMKDKGIAVCIDGPHAPAQVDLAIDELNCDFYTASCHKWLNASLGSGFLYAHPRWQSHMQPSLQSWGRLSPAVPEHWTDEFTWSGTRDPSSYLSIGAAIDFLSEIGLDTFRERSRWLATYGEQALVGLWGHSTIAMREQGCYGSMAHVRLPDRDNTEIQNQLWERHKIEVPVFPFEGTDYLRLSCHLYNSKTQIDHLVESLKELMR